MKEILFKGKTKQDEWIESDSFMQIETFPALLWSKGEGWIKVVPETVGRFTGLTDKNGKKIFEGDIVKTKFGRLCIVVWFSSPCNCGWDLEVIATRKNLETIKPDSYDLWHKNNLEVIGNIHDTPELLGEKYEQRKSERD